MKTRKVLRKSVVATGVWMAIAGAGLHAQMANAHGYIAEPPSRHLLCHGEGGKKNVGCDDLGYNRTAIGEGPKGFPLAGPADGELASAGNSNYKVADEQSANRWYLTPILDRKLDILWNYSTPHKTTKWEYFITKTGWNPNAPLSRAAFESTPFCTIDWNGDYANGYGNLTPGPAKHKHHCELPADRSGHHVVLGLWTVDDTANAFHNMIDVDIQADGGVAPEWPRISEITPYRDLEVGDKVKLRVFVDGLESAQYSIDVTIENAEEGVGANWAYKLAKRVNETQTLMRAGQLDGDGNIEPVKGANTVFAKAEAGISSVELEINAAAVEPGYMHLNDLKPEYTLKDGKTNVDFTVMSNKGLKVKAQLFDANNKQVGFAQQELNGTAKFSLNIEDAAEGAHTLKVVGVDKRERVLLQEERTVQLKAAGDSSYDFVFPESLSSYKAGTKVLQPKNGKVYECKQGQEAGFCVQWSASANGFEPGVGHAWQMAWIEK